MKMRKELYKYQKDLVDKASESTALFWDMGLGKTITSIEIFNKFYSKGEVDLLFVMCPISMIDEWCNEFENQTGMKSAKYKELEKIAKKKNINMSEVIDNLNIHCVVLNYDMVWRIPNYYWVTSKTMLICDESHRIKNPNSKIGKYMKFLKIKTKYKICLTGTPQSSGYIDYYNQLFFLDKIDLTLPEFKYLYCIYENKVFNGIKIKQLVGYKNIEDFKKRYLSKCEFLKIERVYDDIIKHNYIDIEPSKEYKRVLRDKVVYYDKNNKVVIDRDVIQDYLKGKGNDIIKSSKWLDNPGAYRSALRQLLCGENKEQWIKDFLDGYSKRVVIFYNFNVELEQLISIMEKIKRPYSIYNGETKSFDNFKKYDNGVCLCNYKTGSVGINDLVVSNLYIAYSPTENYIEWQQSKKRIDRNGQKYTPIYYYLRSGLENRIYDSLGRGKNFDDKVFITELENDLIK